MTILLNNARILMMSMMFSGAAAAGIRFDPVRVFPESPQRGQPILLLLQSNWPDGCGGTIETKVNVDRIDVIAKPRRDPGVGCTQALVPFTELINPAESLPAGRSFADRVEVRYFVQNADGQNQIFDEDIISFGAVPPIKAALLSGSFSSKSLELSGLFLDQQEGVISTLLSDYNERGESSWRFGAGRLHGNVYVGDLTSYRQIVCVRAPCPRAAPDSTGTISLVVLNQNELVVRFQRSLEPELDGTYSYQRMVFTRAPTLPGAEQEESWLPDLVGEWLVGVTGNQQENASFKRYRIQYIGRLLVNARQFDRRYSAVSVTNPSDFFEINCSDARPVDGIIGCEISDFSALGRRCDVNFEPNSVALGQLKVPATCTKAAEAIETEFLMQRLSR